MLAGCAATVPMRPAADATNPACATVIVGLRDVTIEDAEKRQTSAQATAAWGTPASVLLTCGVEPSGPSELRCVTVDAVDWLIDDSDPDSGVFTTYGRDPATQVVVDLAAVAPIDALSAVSSAVAANPATTECTSPEDFGTGTTG